MRKNPIVSVKALNDVEPGVLGVVEIYGTGGGISYLLRKEGGSVWRIVNFSVSSPVRMTSDELAEKGVVYID